MGESKPNKRMELCHDDRIPVATWPNATEPPSATDTNNGEDSTRTATDTAGLKAPGWLKDIMGTSGAVDYKWSTNGH